MDEPHQRVQSGKLRPVSKSISIDKTTKSRQDVKEVCIGVESAEKLQLCDSDDARDSLYQTPDTLTPFSTGILTEIAVALGISNDKAVNREWRNTWNIGSWCIGSQVSLSINIVQPNISSSWATFNYNKDNDIIHRIAEKCSNYNLPKSTVRLQPTGNGYQTQGRWTLSILDELLRHGAIQEDSIELGSLNIGQSALFVWLLVGKNSEYFCSLTQDSIMLLMKYIPSWCMDLQEASTAGNISLRIKNPTKSHDASQLSISTSGWLQYTGRRESMSRLYEGLGVAIRAIVSSNNLRQFLESMKYEEIPIGF